MTSTKAVGTRANESALGGARASKSTVSLLIESTKPGITRMVTLSAAVGFIVSAAYHGLTLGTLILPAIVCLIGTALAASGANAMNQWLERSRDAVMARTRRRPIPSGGLKPATVLLFSATLSLLGPGVLLAFGHGVAAAIALSTVVLYVALYTPMKAVTPKSTVIGAVPGALPILIGWACASPTSLADLGAWPAWSLFLLLFAWQMPHFLAIAVMYRDQYAAAGYRTLLQTAKRNDVVLVTIAAWSIVMVAASIAPLLAMPELFGLGYGLVALVMGVWMVLLVSKLGRTLAAGGARTLFFASIVYLPVLFIALVADACIGAGWPGT